MYDATHHFPLAHCSQVNLEDFFSLVYILFPSDAAQDRTCTARAVVRSGHRTTARAMKKN